MRRAGFLTNAIMIILIVVLSGTLLFTMFSYRAEQRERTESLKSDSEHAGEEQEAAEQEAEEDAQRIAEEEAEAQLPIAISCRGESWAQDGNDREDGWPAMLGALLEENEVNATVSDYTWDMSGTLSQMRFADVPEATVNEYINKHNNNGMQGIRVETTVRADLEEDYIEREDYTSIPIICIGYNGGYGQSTDELIEQQGIILETYELAEVGNDDSVDAQNGEEYDDGDMEISGKYLIVGHLPAGWSNLENYETRMKDAWGDHFVSLNDIQGDVLSWDFREGVAQKVYDKLVQMKYLEK